MIEIILSLLAFFLCLSVHEAAHAYVSNKLGDPTAKMEGRVSLNPIRHIDPIGTVAVPLFLALSGLPAIGWAKPVMINLRNFKNPSLYNFLTAISGPLSNLIFAVLCAFLYHLFPNFIFIQYVIVINVILAVFNLLPIPPLDGSKVWHLILSDESCMTLEQMGPFILGAFFLFSSAYGNFLFNFIDIISNSILNML